MDRSGALWSERFCSRTWGEEKKCLGDSLGRSIDNKVDAPEGALAYAVGNPVMKGRVLREAGRVSPRGSASEVLGRVVRHCGTGVRCPSGDTSSKIHDRDGRATGGQADSL